MFRVLVKLAIAALLVNGVWRAGTAYWHFYQYEDRLQEIAQFGENRSDKELCGQALEAASTLSLPVSDDAVTIRRGSNPVFNCATGFVDPVGAGHERIAKIFIEAAYTEQLKLLPGYRYAREMKASTSAFVRP